LTSVSDWNALVADEGPWVLVDVVPTVSGRCRRTDAKLLSLNVRE
jgi:hypothetical protein